MVLHRAGYGFDLAGRPEASWLWCRKLLSQNKAVEMKPRRMERQLIWNIRFQVATHHFRRPSLEALGSRTTFQPIPVFPVCKAAHCSRRVLVTEWTGEAGYLLSPGHLHLESYVPQVLASRAPSWHTSLCSKPSSEQSS